MAVILALNAGSSSVKVSVYSTSSSSSESLKQLAEAQISGLTSPPAKLTYTNSSNSSASIKDKEVQDVSSQESAVEQILKQLENDDSLKEISSKDSVTHAVHRVVHGGEYSKPRIINQDTYHHLEELTDLAPLHNSSALAIIKKCTTLLPKAKNIAVFDSSFHQSIPEHIATYPIAQDVAKKNSLKKYGFHGISYQFIARTAAEHLGKKPEQTNLIVLHLGSGASACVIKNGKSWDTSMGLTPVSGLPGATRSGDVDPSMIFHFTHDAGRPSNSSTKELHISKAEEILNKQSGWKAITGTTDFGEISSSNDESHKLAFDLFVNRILNFVGAYYIQLGGKCDALVFAGGIGEKGDRLRKEVVSKADCLGFEIDDQANGKKLTDKVSEIGSKNSKHKVLVVQTDEQFEMARACVDDPELLK